MTKWLKICAVLLGLSLFISSFFTPSAAYADITITPTRVVFNDGDRFSEVVLINTGDKQVTYEINWRFFTMVEGANAAYEEADGPTTEFDLTQHMVYTPRRVTLAPGGKQKIRLALRRPAEVQPGEYRAHLGFSKVREAEPLESAEDPGRKSGALVKINVGYTIPVIFRAGQPDVEGTIESVSFRRNEQNGRLHAIVTLARSGGPYGVLGHLYIYNDKNEVIGEVSNAHIFPEVNRRVLDVPLLDENPGSNLRVVLAHYNRAKGLPNYDEKTFPIRE
ncbi:MAG: hypothetical protein R3E13_08825 [Alphaproteobacteria bacterium]